MAQFQTLALRFHHNLEKFKNDSLSNIINFASPVINFKYWENDYYLASLIDTRFALLKKNADSSFSQVGELMSKGMTKDFAICSNSLFVVDIDSGLTVFSNPANLSSHTVFPQFKNYTKLTAADSIIILSNGKHSAIALKLNKEQNQIISKSVFAAAGGKILSINNVNNGILLQTANKVYVTNPELQIRKTYKNTLPRILKVIKNGSDLYAVFLGGEFAKLQFADSAITVQNIYSFNYNPRNVII